jgi:very-short-patch-repair endonuclease
MFNTKEYLTEENLIEFVKEFISDDLILNKNFLSYKFRPDILINNSKIIIEFDGYTHYTQPYSILKDIEKDNIVDICGYNIIRIPYFVQLDKIVINYLFPQITIYKESEYKHGFIDKKAILPSCFCELGIQKFIKDLETFSFIKEDIIYSLIKKVAELKNKLLVLPPSLLYLLD